MSYTMSAALSLVPSRHDTPNVQVIKEETSFLGLLGGVIEKRKKQNRQLEGERQAAQIIGENMQAHGQGILNRRHMEVNAAVGEAEEDDSLFRKTLFTIIRKVLVWVGKRFITYVLKPILTFAINLVRNLVRFALQAVLRYIIMPIVTAVVGFIVANPITAAIGAVLLASGGVYMLYRKMSKREGDPAESGDINLPPKDSQEDKLARLKYQNDELVPVTQFQNRAETPAQAQFPLSRPTSLIAPAIANPERLDINPAKKTGFVPRSIRNNNPGNLNFVKQPGATKEAGPNGRFAVFPTMQEGIAALFKQLKRYIGRGEDTLAVIIPKYAPASDNNNPTSYAAKLAKDLGITVYDRLDANNANQMITLANGINIVEGGGAYLTRDQFAAVYQGMYGSADKITLPMQGYQAPAQQSTAKVQSANPVTVSSSFATNKIAKAVAAESKAAGKGGASVSTPPVATDVVKSKGLLIGVSNGN